MCMQNRQSISALNLMTNILLQFKAPRRRLSHFRDEEFNVDGAQCASSAFPLRVLSTNHAEISNKFVHHATVIHHTAPCTARTLTARAFSCVRVSTPTLSNFENMGKGKET